MTTQGIQETPHDRQLLERVTVRFAGDSGDGMQLVGGLFASEAAWMGNDLGTLPDFPAEVRAPSGTVAAVSGFQIQIGASTVHTPGEESDVLVAMNPAALRAGLKSLRLGGVVLFNTSSLSERSLQKAGLSPEDLDAMRRHHQVIDVEMSRLCQLAVADTGLTKAQAERCKNFFALGLLSWMLHRDISPTVRWIQSKFAKKPAFADANVKALEAGYRCGENTELAAALPLYHVPEAAMAPGRYANLTGNQAMVYGLMAAACRSKRPIFLGSYPITPATDILHEMIRLRQDGATVFQAEDEIAAVCAAIGASYSGQIGVTSTSGPGFTLKQEALGLAVMTELPLVVLDIARAGPSTGMPTKTEQSDLLQALHGRHGEAPVFVLAASSPADCFAVAYEAVRLAMTYMTPVVVLSDSYLANGSEPFRIPAAEELPAITVALHQDATAFLPYGRDPVTLARPWAVPGTRGLEHRIGGLEKEENTGKVSHDPANHEAMMQLRAAKIHKAAASLPPVQVMGDPQAPVLLVGWGSTLGAITEAREQLQQDGLAVAQVHLTHLNPLPPNLEKVLRSYERVIVPEVNSGQLAAILRERFLIPTIGFNRIQGQPLRARDIHAFVLRTMEESQHVHA